MHPTEVQSPPPPTLPAPGTSWRSEMTGYHWFVFVVAALGWLADCMDQQLFNLARKQAVTNLIGASPGDLSVDKYATWATSIFLIGWAIGGIIFGVMGDRWGRVKTMLLTILIYSIFTGLSALSFSFWDFALYRFLTGLGVGGEFAVGVALLAEVMPDRARPHALGLLQAFSAIGNCTAALLFMLLGYLTVHNSLHVTAFGRPVEAWRLMFLFGLAPAALALLVRRRLKEPERWQVAVAEGGQQKKAGSYAELFGDPRWRHNALVGLALAFAGVVGLWAIGFFSIDLVQNILGKVFEKEGLKGNELDGNRMIWAGWTSLMLNIGAFFGIYSFSRLTHVTGRRAAFAVSFFLAIISTAAVFWFLERRSDIFWMIPIMGFCQLALFGGYAIYFPELFPTRLRSTGTSFCYNVGRLVAAVGPVGLGLFTSVVFAHTAGTPGEPGYDPNMPRRLAGVTMCAVFLIGLAALPFAPETKGKPLPE
jgi:MFS family permease